jgi:threonine/homoserine/homoserine lactone efflux protein
MDTQLLTFAGITLGLTMMPGANMMLVVRNSMSSGQRAGILTAIGGGGATLLHALLSALGLSMILVNSVVAFEVIRTIGAFYLIFLGGQSLWRAWRQSSSKSLDVKRIVAPTTPRQSLIDGFITNLFSPETTIFYLAVAPQFIQPGESVLAKTLLLATIHFVMRLVWYAPVTLFVGRIRAWLNLWTIQRGIEIITGILLVIFGIRLLMSRR